MSPQTEIPCGAARPVLNCKQKPILDTQAKALTLQSKPALAKTHEREFTAFLSVLAAVTLLWVFSFYPDKKPLEIDARMNLISCPDGRQLLMIMKTTKKDAGLYECVATNPLASVTSSCTLSLAREFHRHVKQLWQGGDDRER